MTERWRPLEEYSPSGYEVSDHGRIRRNGVLRKLQTDRYGYKRISLRKGTKQKLPTVHSLVAAAFIGPRPKGLEIAHLDENKTNNHFKNLEYVTGSQNRQHSVASGRIAHGARHGRAKLTEAQADQIRRSAEKTKVLAERYGVNRTTIQRIRSGELWRDRTAAAALSEGEG